MLIALSFHADWSPKGFGRCFPRRDTLALETKLQVSHVSEAVSELAYTHGLITVVRLGRKNVYYVREIGATSTMPPSDPDSFFKYLGQLGIYIKLTAFPVGVQYKPESRKFEDFPHVLRRIFSDYVNGLTPGKLDQAVRVNELTPVGSIIFPVLESS